MKWKLSETDLEILRSFTLDFCNRMPRFFLQIIVIISLYSSAFGQNFRMSGKIRCYQTRKIIAAKVSFEKLPDASLTFISHSAEDGYSATIARPGAYFLKASMAGYLPEYHEINLDHDSLRGKEELEYNFSLVPIELEQIMPFRNILFDPSSSSIAPIALPELLRLVEILNENPSLKIRLEGHTDNVAKSRKSLDLAKRRIKSVKQFLVSKGISSSRVRIKAFGGGNPLFRHGTQEAHQANRRVEVRIISL